MVRAMVFSDFPWKRSTELGLICSFLFGQEASNLAQNHHLCYHFPSFAIIFYPSSSYLDIVFTPRGSCPALQSAWCRPWPNSVAAAIKSMITSSTSKKTQRFWWRQLRQTPGRDDRNRFLRRASFTGQDSWGQIDGYRKTTTSHNIT